jgi:hypothetical protein
MQDPGGIQVDPTVPEGGTIVVRVRHQATEVRFVVPGVGVVRVTPVGGRAEYTLPPEVRGGARITVSDMRLPRPASATVDVTGGSSR